MVETQHNLRSGDRVMVPWGMDEIMGTVLEVWGSPPAHVRVALELEANEEPEVLLLNPRVVRKIS